MKYRVLFKIITPDLAFTPMGLIPTEETVVECNNQDDFELSKAISNEFNLLNINPDHIRIQDKYEVGEINEIIR